MAVGIGNKISQSELEIIAGDPGRVVNAKNFDDLNNQLGDIRESTCSKYFFDVEIHNLKTKIQFQLKKLRTTSYHMCVEFVVGSRPCTEGVSPGSPVFLPL